LTCFLLPPVHFSLPPKVNRKRREEKRKRVILIHVFPRCFISGESWLNGLTDFMCIPRPNPGASAGAFEPEGTAVVIPGYPYSRPMGSCTGSTTSTGTAQSSSSGRMLPYFMHMGSASLSGY